MQPQRCLVPDQRGRTLPTRVMPNPAPPPFPRRLSFRSRVTLPSGCFTGVVHWSFTNATPPPPQWSTTQAAAQPPSRGDFRRFARLRGLTTTSNALRAGCRPKSHCLLGIRRVVAVRRCFSTPVVPLNAVWASSESWPPINGGWTKRVAPRLPRLACSVVLRCSGRVKLAGSRVWVRQSGDTSFLTRRISTLLCGTCGSRCSRLASTGGTGTARFSRLPIGHPGLRGWRTCSKTRSFVRRGRTRSWTSSELSTLTGRGTGMTGARSFRLPPMRFELQSVRIDQPELILPSLMTSSLEPVGLVAARSFMTSTAIPLRSRSGDTPATDRRRGSCRLRFSDMRAVSAAIGAIR